MPKYLYAYACLVVNDFAGMKDFIMTARNIICLQIIVRCGRTEADRMRRLNQIVLDRQLTLNTW